MRSPMSGKCKERVERRSKLIVAVDAMGVLYQPADDVQELLVPFLRARGCSASASSIAQLYEAASRGALSAGELWDQLSIPGDRDTLDSEFASQYRLTEGAKAFLEWCAEAGIDVQCVSNDLCKWAALRAQHLGVSALIRRWTISAAVGYRKPSPEIFEAFLSGADPSKCLFVDDRLDNVVGAQSRGIRSVWFNQGPPHLSEGVATAQDFRALIEIIESVIGNVARD